MRREGLSNDNRHDLRHGRDVYDIDHLPGRSIGMRLLRISAAIVPVVLTVAAIAWFMRSFIAPPIVAISNEALLERSAVPQFVGSTSRNSADMAAARPPVRIVEPEPATPGSVAAAFAAASARDHQTAAPSATVPPQTLQRSELPEPAALPTAAPSPAAATSDFAAVRNMPSPPVAPRTTAFPERAALPIIAPSPPPVAAVAEPISPATVPLPRRRPKPGQLDESTALSALTGGQQGPPLPQERPATAPGTGDAQPARPAADSPGFDRDRVF